MQKMSILKKIKKKKKVACLKDIVWGKKWINSHIFKNLYKNKNLNIKKSKKKFRIKNLIK